MKRATKIEKPLIGDLVMLSPKAPILGWIHLIEKKRAMNSEWDSYHVEWFANELDRKKWFSANREPAEQYPVSTIVSMKQILKDYLKNENAPSF